jgi:hypothetical protein
MTSRDTQRGLKKLGYELHEGWLSALVSTKPPEDPEKEYHTPPKERPRKAPEKYAEPKMIERKPSERQAPGGTTGTSGI